MTPDSKNKRREEWKTLNFAGTIDWAVDLQRFGEEDLALPEVMPQPGHQGCISGIDATVNSGDLCEWACNYGYCPQSLCECLETGEVPPYPKENKLSKESLVQAWDNDDVDLNRLCKFACKHGYCPSAVCTDYSNTINDPSYNDGSAIKYGNNKHCYVSDDPRYRNTWEAQCSAVCSTALAEAAAEGRVSSHFCFVFWKDGDPDPWGPLDGQPGKWARGTCMCDHGFINAVAEMVIDALPAIAQVCTRDSYLGTLPLLQLSASETNHVGQIACYITMSTFKFVLDIGTELATGGWARYASAPLGMYPFPIEVPSPTTMDRLADCPDLLQRCLPRRLR